MPKILLIGDSGVGKSLVANFISENVLRLLKDGLDFGKNIDKHPARISIPEFVGKEDDFEYRLFGFAKGAFTTNKEEGDLGLLLKNMFRVVFLDEIGAANYSIQSKLLAYLDDYKVPPRGWTDEPFSCPTLIVAATNERRKLQNNDAFRNDLLARFTDRLEIPNIKERIDGKEENLLYLLDCILQVPDINPEPQVKEIGKLAFGQLYNHFKGGCAGNFRELENLMREACEQAREDKRDYMVENDVKKAIDELHLDATSSSSQCAVVNGTNDVSSREVIVNQSQPREDAKDNKDGICVPTYNDTNLKNQKKQFLEKNRMMKKGRTPEDIKAVNKLKLKVIKRILKDKLGYFKIFGTLSDKEKQLLSPGEDGQLSALQRLCSAIRTYFHLPQCRKGGN